MLGIKKIKLERLQLGKSAGELQKKLYHQKRYRNTCEGHGPKTET